MNPIKQCYLAYTNSKKYQSPARIMGDAAEMLLRKEYGALEAGIGALEAGIGALEAGIGALEEKAFDAGFRFAVRLLAEGMRW